MAKSQILWTILPFGRSPEDGPGRGRWRLSVVVSPRLTPEASREQVLAAFAEWLNWPKTLDAAKFSVTIGSDTVGLVPLSTPDPDLWAQLFGKATPVAGFVYKDMSKVNLRSFPVRNVLSLLKRNYTQLAVQSSSNRPTLLPWANAHPDLKRFLTDTGTRTQKLNFGDRSIEVAAPGFSRFFDPGFEKTVDGQVFGPNGTYSMPVASPFADDQGPPKEGGRVQRRAMRPDWYNPQPGGPGTPLVNQADASLMAQFASADEYGLYQADRFYRRTTPSSAERAMRHPSYADIPEPPKAPDYDFHRIVASFGTYPELMRRLGLVLDFAVEKDDPIDQRIAAAGGMASGRVRLHVDWSARPGTGVDQTPFTAFQADKDRFVPRPRGGDQARGLLRLEHSDDSYGDKERGLFDLYQVDPDGAALKTVNFTLTAQNLVGKSLSPRQKYGEVTYTTGDRQGVAALRSGGLGVSRHGRATEVAAAAAAGAAKNDVVAQGHGSDMTLFAEDVHRGYRVDVAAVADAATPGKWQSLCARVGDYRLIKAGHPIDLPADEGAVSGASTTSSDDAGANPDDHYLHESLFRWTGWSLCAPRPGLALQSRQADDSQVQAEVPSRIVETADGGNGVAATFTAAKGTLPRLRFGQLYRMRARIVDLAGNSLAVDDRTLGPLEQASDAVGYWRFEPVDPPTLVHRTRVSEGESLERLVIRSNYDVDAQAYLQTDPFKTASTAPASTDFEYGEVNERHVVPPKSSQQQCETHGLFDPYFGDWQAIRKGYEIAAREAGTLYDPMPGAQIELVTPQSLGNVATTSTLPPALPDATNPEGDRLAGGQYVIHREEHVATPWLPDGAAGGVAIRAVSGSALPGITGPGDLGPHCAVRMTPSQELVILVANAIGWPDSAGFRLILAERKAEISSPPCSETFQDDGKPLWDDARRTLTFFVPKGRIVRLVYSSFIDPHFIQSFGIVKWAAAGNQNFVTATARLGANWLLTPFRNLTLVHATQAPVCEPEFVLMSVQRQLGSHDATIFARAIRLHGPSTGKFEIEAEWKEWVDDLAKPTPERVSFKGQLGEVRLAENHANEFLLRQAVDDQMPDPKAARGDVHALGDARFRLIRYRVRATTRFREYLPPSVYADSDAVTRVGPIATGALVKLPDEGDPGAPVLADASGTGAQSIVPATAPPTDPRVLYVVPTFRWQTANGAAHDVTRYGNGLRVWLDRPWFSSGDGELLGVVVFGDGARFTDVPAPFQPLVTQWGTDPLWDSPLPKTSTRLTDFAGRVTAEQVRLQEHPDGSDPFVQVVGHRVHWDDDRHLWYCDIDLDPGSTYMPFVRLALVRYQPNALDAAKISKVVLTEFAQVLPRRRALVAVTGGTVDISLYGPSPAFGPMKFPVESEYQNIAFAHGVHEGGGNRVELVLQTQDAGIDSELGWQDSQILASQVLGTPVINALPGIGSPVIAAPLSAAAPSIPAVKAAQSPPVARPIVQPAPATRIVETRAGGSVALPGTIERVPPDLVLRRPPFVLDPAIWQANAQFDTAGNQRKRLMIREFERFYTDHVIADKVGDVNVSRRVIEERLVYADIVTL